MFRSIAEKGPSTEEKVASIEASLSTYEAKIQGLGKCLPKTVRKLLSWPNSQKAHLKGL